MKNIDLNLLQLEGVALALGDLLPQLTFVGGSATALLNDDFLNVLPGLLNNANAASGVHNTLRIMQSWAEGD